MKFCKDCKYLARDLWCNSPKSGVSLVTGKPTPRFAEIYRKESSKTGCGEDGIWFEPKEEVAWLWWKLW